MVDLADPRCAGKAQSRRFVARVFDTSEAERLGASRDADRLLWLYWAAKEAAFKVVSKLLPSPPPFVHAAFRIAREPSSSQPVGRVEYRDLVIPFFLEETAASLHVVAWHAGSAPIPGIPGALRWGSLPIEHALPSNAAAFEQLLESHFTSRERGPVHSMASAAVRIAARRGVADALGVPLRSLEIICEGGSAGRTPPRLFSEGVQARSDVSLSHHGRLVAWAAGLATGAGGS